MRLLTWTLTLAALAAPAGGQDALRIPVRQFISAHFHHGVPYRAARVYGAAAVPELIAVLKDDEARHMWPNAVWLLGMIGEPAAADALIEFQHRFSGEVDRPTFNALLQVNPALGFLARKADSTAFRYLREGSMPGAWSERVNWYFGATPERQRNLLLAQLAINGLGISGSASARTEMGALGDRLGSDREILRDNIRESMEMSRRIEELGYERVFSGDQGDE